MIEGVKTAQISDVKTGADAGLADGEAVVMISVYDHLDSDGDRTKADTFTDFAKAFNEQGDPQPLLFAHDHRNLDAYIGDVIRYDPAAVNEKGQTGLAAHVKFDLEDPAGRKAYKLNKGRRVNQWSYHYRGERTKTADGSYDLGPLEITEASLVLRGANDQTSTIAIKEHKPPEEQLKSYVDVAVPGSFEETQAMLRDALNTKYPSPAGGQSWVYVNIVATTSSQVTYQVCYSGPAFEGKGDQMFRSDYSVTAGEVKLGDPTEVTVTIAPKAEKSSEPAVFILDLEAQLEEARMIA